MRVACILAPLGSPLHSLAEACYMFSPQIAVGDRAVFIEIGACKKLYSEDYFLRRVRVVAKKFSISADIAIADDAPTARAMAKFKIRSAEFLPVEAISLYLDPWVESSELSFPILAFKKLGLRYLHEILSIPKKSLILRFGKPIFLAVERLECSSQIPWPAFSPSEKIIESQDIEHDIREVEGLSFVLKQQLDRLMFRCKGQGKLISALEIRIGVEKNSQIENPVLTFPIQLTFPLRSSLTLLSMVRDRLAFSFSKNPLEAPIRKLELEITELAKDHPRQSHFFSKQEEENQKLQEIVSRLCEKLGFNKAFFASAVESYTPEKAWKRTLESTSVSFSPLPERPLRLLRMPQKIHSLEDYFFIPGHRWKASEMIGPERLSGEWWFLERARDYYRIVTTEGQELWVYSLPGTRDFYLHGIFD